MQWRTVLLVRSTAYGWTELRLALETLPGVRVVGVADRPEQAVRDAIALKPDIIISAASVAEWSTLPFLHEVRATIAPTSKLLVIADRFDPDELAVVANLGVAGHLLWSDVSSETLPHLLAAVFSGDIVVASRSIADAFVAARNREPRSEKRPPPLDPRDRRVFGRLADGATHGEIARAEGVSPRTVERIIAKLETKLDAPNQFVLGWKASRFGVLADEPMTNS